MFLTDAASSAISCAVLLPEGRALEASQEAGAEHGPAQGLATPWREAQAVCRACPRLRARLTTVSTAPAADRWVRVACPPKRTVREGHPALHHHTASSRTAHRATPRSTLQAGAQRLRPEGAGSLTASDLAVHVFRALYPARDPLPSPTARRSDPMDRQDDTRTDLRSVILPLLRTGPVETERRGPASAGRMAGLAGYVDLVIKLVFSCA